MCLEDISAFMLHFMFCLSINLFVLYKLPDDDVTTLQ